MTTATVKMEKKRPKIKNTTIVLSLLIKSVMFDFLMLRVEYVRAIRCMYSENMRQSADSQSETHVSYM